MTKECVKCGRETPYHYYLDFKDFIFCTIDDCNAGNSYWDIFCCKNCSKGPISVPSYIPKKQYGSYIRVYLKGENK